MSLAGLREDLAEIADAVVRYVRITGDVDFEEATGVELLVETARVWRDLGHFDAEGRFRIDGVTGPDEYSPLADNNTYTNLMAQQNLRAAAEAVERYPQRAGALNASPVEVEDWRAAADAMMIPFNDRLGVHEQAQLFTELEEWDFGATPAENYPLLLHYPYFQLYRKQVIKQPDLVLAMHLRSDAFTAEEKARNFAYYERLTVRDSSLSDATEAVIAAEVGHLELAYDYLVEAALLDLDDLQHNTRDGIHIAAVAGVWIALVAGFGGVRVPAGGAQFAPRLPSRISRLTFKLQYRGRRLQVTTLRESATYTLLDGSAAIELMHHGERFTLSAGAPVTLKIPPPPEWPAPKQPPGREPFRR